MRLAPLMSDNQIKHIRRESHVLFLSGRGHLQIKYLAEERKDKKYRGCLSS